jgi:hypothetical protein
MQKPWLHLACEYFSGENVERWSWVLWKWAVLMGECGVWSEKDKEGAELLFSMNTHLSSVTYLCSIRTTECGKNLMLGLEKRECYRHHSLSYTTWFISVMKLWTHQLISLELSYLL